MAEFGKLNFAVAFNPQTAFPLDARYYFDSLSAAQTAAQGAVEVGSASGTYFFGQTVVVVESSVATLYVIQPDKTLQPVGSTVLGDNKSITVSDGQVQLVGFSGATVGQQPRIGSNGSLEWYTPDTSSVEGLQQTVGQLQTDVTQLKSDVGTINDTLETKANISDVYTQTQTDEKIAAAVSSTYKPSGSVEFASLPTPSVENLGNVYNVTDAFTADVRFVEGENGKQYPAGTNVAVVEVDDDYYFDALAGVVDLSNYATNDSVDSKVSTAIQTLDKSDSAVQKQFVTAVSQTNGIIAVTRAALQATDIPTIEQTQVNGLVGALAGKADDSALATIAKTGNVNDLVQSGSDWIVFNCGSSSTII